MAQEINRALELMKRKIDEIGHAQVAIRLGYKDTGPIKKWIKRESIPPSAIALILKLWGNGSKTKHIV